MRQGRATHSGMGSTKTEPRSHTVPPAYPASLGNMVGNHADAGMVTVQKVPMYTGSGPHAPSGSTTIHRGGSQGKHK